MEQEQTQKADVALPAVSSTEWLDAMEADYAAAKANLLLQRKYHDAKFEDGYKQCMDQWMPVIRKVIQKGNPAVGLHRLVRRIHVVPVGDEEIHAAQEVCWCHPTETEPKLWVHNAKDCREAKERATGEKCSDGWISIAEFIAPNEKVRDSEREV